MCKIILPHRVFLDVPGDAPDLGPEGNAVGHPGELFFELRGVIAQDRGPGAFENSVVLDERERTGRGPADLSDLRRDDREERLEAAPRSGPSCVVIRSSAAAMTSWMSARSGT